MKYVPLRLGMMNKVVLAILIISLLLFSLASPLWAGIELVSCCDSRGHCGYSIGSSWNDTYNGTQYLCTCTSGGGNCSPSGGSSSGKSSKKGLSNKNRMKLDMLQGAMDDFANAFIKWINAPSEPAQTGPTPEQIAAQKEAEERAKAEFRAKLQQQIKEMESEYEQQERQKAAASKASLLAGMKGMDTAGLGSRSVALQQLKCKAYWAMKAAKASDEEKAKEYSRFAENPDADAKAECAMALPEPPMPSSAGKFRIELYETMIEEINMRLPLIKQAKEKQNSAAGKVAEKQHQVDELKVKKEAAATAEEKQDADYLLAEAMKQMEEANKLKNEADVGLVKLQAEIDALNEVGKIASGAPQ